MKLIKWIIMILIVFVPFFMTIMAYNYYIPSNTTINGWILHLALMASYIFYADLYIAVLFDKWFDSKLK